MCIRCLAPPYGGAGEPERACKDSANPGGAAALGSPYGGAGERSASLRGCRQLQIREKYGDCSRVPSQSRLTPCQLSQRESQGAGLARPAHRNFCIANLAAQSVIRANLAAQSVRPCNPGGAAALGSPYGGAGERSASLRGRRQLQIREKYGDCCMVPSQSRLTPCQLSQRESQGAGFARPAHRNHQVHTRPLSHG